MRNVSISSDMIYFPRGHPVLISGIGKWLSEKTEDKRPAVFFRIIGDELTDLDTGRFKPRAAFYRLASADLDNASARERVFFLVNSSAKARSVTDARASPSFFHDAASFRQAPGYRSGDRESRSDGLCAREQPLRPMLDQSRRHDPARS